MSKTKLLWIVTEDEALKESLQFLVKNGYRVLFFYSYQDFKQKLNEIGIERPKLYLFDEASSKKFFYVERTGTIDSSQVIVLGDDNPENIRLFYSIGLTHLLSRNSFQNHLLVKIEFLLGELLNYTQWNLEDLKWDDLTFKEKKILKILCHRPDQAVDRSEIIRFVWKNEKVHSRTFDVHLHNLRKKIEKYGYEVIALGQGKYQIQNQPAVMTA